MNLCHNIRVPLCFHNMRRYQSHHLQAHILCDFPEFSLLKIFLLDVQKQIQNPLLKQYKLRLHYGAKYEPVHFLLPDEYNKGVCFYCYITKQEPEYKGVDALYQIAVIKSK